MSKPLLKNTPAKLIAALAYLAYSCVYLCRLNLSVASVSICESGYMSEAEIGVLSSLFLASYAFGKLVLGRVGDKLPPKALIVSGLFMCAFANFVFAFFPPTGILYILWLLNGVAQSLIWGPILRIVSSHFSKKHRAVVLSYLATCVGVGSILGVAAATVGISLFKTVSAAFFIPAGITALVSMIFLLAVHDKEENEEKLPPIPLKEIFSDPAFRRMAFPAFLHGIIKDNINVWLCLFFASVYDLQLEKLAFFIFIVPTLTLIGRILFVPFLKLCGNNENHVAAVSLVFCAIFSLLLATGVLPLPAALICFSGTACMISMTNTTLLSVFPARYLERGCVSSVASYMDVLTYSGASLGSLVFGVAVKSLGYSPMFISWTVIAGVSAILMLYKSKS